MLLEIHFSPEVTHLLRSPVSSAISCIVIKSDPAPRQIPKLGQTVGIVGQRGLFVVMSLDDGRRIAHLMERSGKHRLIEAPFESLRTFNRKLAEALNRFLRLREDAKPRER